MQQRSFVIAQYRTRTLDEAAVNPYLRSRHLPNLYIFYNKRLDFGIVQKTANQMRLSIIPGGVDREQPSQIAVRLSTASKSNPTISAE
jgi:hypothetical protein